MMMIKQWLWADAQHMEAMYYEKKCLGCLSIDGKKGSKFELWSQIFKAKSDP